MFIIVDRPVRDRFSYSVRHHTSNYKEVFISCYFWDHTAVGPNSIVPLMLIMDTFAIKKRKHGDNGECEGEERNNRESVSENDLVIPTSELT